LVLAALAALAALASYVSHGHHKQHHPTFMLAHEGSKLVLHAIPPVERRSTSGGWTSSTHLES